MFSNFIKSLKIFINNYLSKEDTITSNEAVVIDFSDIIFFNETGDIVESDIIEDEILVSSFENTVLMPIGYTMVIRPHFLDKDGKQTNHYDTNGAWSIVPTNGGVFDYKAYPSYWCHYKPSAVGKFQISFLLDSDVTNGEKAVLGYVNVEVKEKDNGLVTPEIFLVHI